MPAHLTVEEIRITFPSKSLGRVKVKQNPEEQTLTANVVQSPKFTISAQGIQNWMKEY